jgi:hypothetical protein
MIYSREKKRRRVEEEILGTTNDVPELLPALRNKGGRPLGATNKVVPEIVPALHNKGGHPLGATNEAKRDREGREHKAKAHAVETLLAR